MVKLEIKGTGLVYNLPVALHEITLDKGLSIQVLIEDKEMSEYDKRISILNILTSCPVKNLLKINVEHLNTIYENLPYLNNFTKIYYKIPFKINRTIYELRNFDEFTVKQFIEVEFNIKEDFIENVPKNILLLTFKKSSPLLNIYSKALTENDLLQKLDYATALGVLGEWNKWRKKLQQEFYLLFEQDEDIPEDWIEPEPEKKYLSVHEIWSWYHIINGISSSRMEFDLWMEKPMRELLVYLSYLKQRNLELKKMK
jgi:hypothetical protein